MEQFTTKIYIIKGLILFVGGIAAALIVYTTHWYWTYTSQMVITDPTVLNHGLESINDQDFTGPHGYLYFLGTPEFSDDFLPVESIPESVFALKLTGNNTIRELPTLSNQSTGSIFALAQETSKFGSIDEVHPAKFTLLETENGSSSSKFLETPSYWYEGAVKVSPTQEWLVYDGQVTNQGQGTYADYNDLDNWDVVLYNLKSSEFRIIQRAGHPVWFNGGDDILFVRTDGIYRYNLGAAGEERIISDWNNLDYRVQLAVPNNSASLVITIPQLNAVALYSFVDPVNGVLQQEGIITVSQTYFTEPVFSPSGLFYAVISTINNQDDLTSSIQIRSIGDRTVINNIPIPFDQLSYFTLLDWREIIEPLKSPIITP